MGRPSGPEFDAERPLTCDSARELISAEADDALVGDEAELLHLHVDGCAGCTAYRSEVAALARSTRVRAATFDPGFVDAVMQRTQPARLGRGGWLRPALAWCGLVIAGQSVAPLVFGDLDGTPTHVARHVGASTLALAIGLLFVAWRPHRAAGLLPYVGALFGSMFAGAVFDVIGGDRSPVSELAHVAELVGMVLLWMIAGSPGWDRVERAFSSGRRGVAAPTS
jgi:predicted anti-sigma-YlaC factor YlaD